MPGDLTLLVAGHPLVPHFLWDTLERTGWGGEAGGGVGEW